MAKNVFDDPQLSPQLPTGEVTFGQVLGARYRLDEQLHVEDEIGLWRGWDEQLSRIVLLYVLPPNHPRTEDVLTAARAASLAVDTRFLRVLDALEYGPSEPVTFVVCECVPGYHLQAVLAAGPVGSLAAIWLASEIAKALLPLHVDQTSHGRLDPDAVVVTNGGNIKISGFMLDAALRPDPTEADLDWEQREARDVQALGQILYAALTGHWPLIEGGRDVGLPTVALDSNGLIPPSELRPGVPQVLDVICTQILAPMPDNPKLGTAYEVANALAQVLGPADAADDLAYRVRALAVAQEPDVTGQIDITAKADTPTISISKKILAPPPKADPDRILDEYEDSVSLELSLSGGQQPTGDSKTEASTDDSTTGSVRYGGPVLGTVPVVSRPSSPENDDAKTPPWKLGLGILLAVALFFVFKSLFGGDGIDPTTTASSEPKAAISNAVSFDPVADGGSGDECDDAAGKAVDGDPTTYWDCNYYDTDVPSMKPGFGLMLTLSDAQAITAVGIQVPTPGATVRIMIPDTLTDTGGSVPMDSVQSWREIGGGQIDGNTARFVLDQPVTTKYVLVYASRLADVGNWQYQFAVNEITVYTQS